VITWVGAAYAVYSIAMTLIQIIYKCEASEYQLDADRQLKECHYVGSYCDQDVLGLCVERKESYCCFASPLGRIVQEQVRNQLGIGWGSPQSAMCGGLALSTLHQVNWSAIDLSEWVALEAQSGVLATPSSLSADSLTGSGNGLAVGTVRENVIARTQDRTNGTNLSTTMDSAAGHLMTTVGPLP